MKTARMQKFENQLLGSRDSLKNQNFQSEGDANSSYKAYKGIWDDDSALPEQIESDQELGD